MGWVWLARADSALVGAAINLRGFNPVAAVSPKASLSPVGADEQTAGGDSQRGLACAMPSTRVATPSERMAGALPPFSDDRPYQFI